MVQAQYLVMVAAATLFASADGLQVVPNSAKSTSLRAPAEERYQPYVEGKTDRFLISEAKNDAATEAPTGYVLSTLQEDDDDMLQQDDDDEYEDESDSFSGDGSSSEERARRRRKRRKKKKHKETETPTPTPTLEPNATATPSPCKKAFRFVPSSDIMLLKEVLKHRLWAASHGETLAAWTSVTTRLKAALISCTADGKARRRRFNALLQVFRRDELESLRASGSAEVYEECEQLLTDRMTLFRAQWRAYDSPVQEALKVSYRPPQPSKKKKTSSTEALVEFHDTKTEARISREKQKERQLDPEERRLALEEQRLQQDRDRLDKLMGMKASQIFLMSKLIEKMNQ
ncbi:hypothetical protein PInf_008606 [Phytophthora infestans]|nr:hypothetical protein PInf_008606 [Phytophthora infestans]